MYKQEIKHMKNHLFPCKAVKKKKISHMNFSKGLKSLSFENNFFFFFVFLNLI